jgi:hypothetical protein
MKNISICVLLLVGFCSAQVVNQGAMQNLNNNFTATNTFTGPTSISNLSVQSRNLTLFADQFPGATFDQHVQACLNAVVAAGGGICDATGLPGTQTISSEIDVGTRLGSGITRNQISATLLLAPSLVATVNFISPGACGIKVFSESRLIGTGQGITHSSIIVGGSGASMGSVVCDDYTAGTGQYVAVQGVQITNSGGGTFTNGLMYIKNTYDASSIRDVLVSASTDTSLLHVEATCCATLFQNIILDCNFEAACVPLQIDSLIGDLQPVLDTVFVGISADHPGPTKNAIQIKNTYTSTNNPCNFSFFGLYMEGSSTDTVTPLVNDDSCTSVQFSGVAAQFRATGSTAVAFNVANTSVGGIVPALTVTNFQYQNSGIVFPYTAINDNSSGATSPAIFTDSQGALGSYIGGVNVATNMVFPEIGMPHRSLHVDVCKGTSSHNIQCSYNGGPPEPLSQTVAAGTSAMATSLLGAGVCAAAVTTVAANVLTTDSIMWSFNAAPGTGYGSATGAGLVIQSYPTAGNVNFVVCNPTAGNITPAAATLNWRVIR